MENLSSDEYSSVMDYFSVLLSSPQMLAKEVKKLNGEMLVQFYEYVVGELDKDSEELDKNPAGSDMLWLAVLTLEDMPVIQMYKKGTEYVNVTLDNRDVSRTESSPASESFFIGMDNREGRKNDRDPIIQEILDKLDARRKMSPIKRLMKIIKQ